MILESIFKKDYSKIFLFEEFSKCKINDLKDILNAYNCMSPLEYILKKAFFYENYFYVDKNVLIPRAETEVLVEKAISLKPKTVLEVGTGSGCIILSILDKLKISKGFGLDLSKEALGIAIKNKNNLQISNCEFKISDLLEKIKTNSQFDLIIANLPYVPKGSYVGAKTYFSEPHLALFANKNGLLLIEKLIIQLRDKKIKFKYLLLEFHYNHSQKITNLVKENFNKSKIEIFADYCGHQRFVLVEMP